MLFAWKSVRCLFVFNGIQGAKTLMTHELKTFEANVIIFREDSEWTALALEMNIRGYGATPAAAVQDVIELLDAQISFAVQMGHPESVWHRAPQNAQPAELLSAFSFQLSAAYTATASRYWIS
jgi:hypothetical protein